MSQDQYTIIRKIQLLINSEDETVKRNIWETLFQWRYMCFRAANYIASHFYLQDQIKEMIYLTDAVKVKLADIRKDELGIFTTSSANTTYQLLGAHFKGEIPMQIIGALNNTIASTVSRERLAITKGEKSVRNYKRTIPIPFPTTAFRNIKLAENKKFYTFTLFGLEFRTYFGADKSNNRIMWERAITGEYKLCTSSIIMDKGKIFLLAAFKIEKEKSQLNIDVVAEVSLSIEIPLIVKIGKYKYEIGNKEEYLHRRLSIQQARRRCQSGASNNRPQHGKKRKLKAILNYKEKEKNYINTKLHVYSRNVIDLCIKHGAATLILVDQSEKEQIAKEDQFLLRNWGYFNLRQKLEYKAGIAGIKILVE